MQIYGITGTFFMAGERPQVVHAADSQGGIHVELVSEAMSHVFSGHFAYAENGEHNAGVMLDTFGPSELFISYFSPDTLVFFKRYLHRSNEIRYDVTLQADGTWHGGYQGELVGTGLVRCKLVELEAALFNLDPSTAEV